VSSDGNPTSAAPTADQDHADVQGQLVRWDEPGQASVADPAKRDEVRRISSRRRELFDQLHSEGPFVAVVDDGGVYHLASTTERGASRALFSKRQSPAQRYFRRALQPLKQTERRPGGERALILEGYSRSGWIVPGAVRRHGFEAGVVVEQDPDRRRLIHATLVLNGLDDRVTTVVSRPGPGEGRVALRITKHWGDHREVDEATAATLETKGRAIWVSRRTLDDIARERADGALDRFALVWTGRDIPLAAALDETRALVAAGAALAVELADPLDAAAIGALSADIAERFDTVVDLNLGERGVADADPGAVAELLERYRDPGESGSTVVLLLPPR
jgi:hypothetical protein